MGQKTIVLPSREEMLKRLIKVNNTPHLQEKFYPILLKRSGQEFIAQGVVMMLALAIYDYVKVEGMPPIMLDLIFMQADKFIDALIDDKEVAEEAKKFLKKQLDNAKK